MHESRSTGKLDLLGFGLDSLPPSLAKNLPALTQLHINTNSLSALPVAVTKMTKLQSFIARYNQLQELPARFESLASLLKLDLSNNLLSELPPGLGTMPVLQTLDLNSNHLVRLPHELCHLRMLKTLLLHGNRLELLPPDMGTLPSLLILDASSNALCAVPESLGYLQSLQELNLSSNTLEELPPSLGGLRCLQKLNLSSNGTLRALPSLSQMVSLRSLDVEACALAELPSISEMKSLRSLSWKKNPLQRPPASVAAQGLDAIRRYFDELERAGATISYAARLVLLGDGMAGKTSLQRGLAKGGTPSPTSVDARTIQLDITSLTFFENDPTQHEVTFSVWDLGGQVNYAAAQQPYIAPGSLYLIVVPAPQANDAHFASVLGRWLAYLQAGAPAAYVLPVLSQCDKMLPPASSANVGIGKSRDVCAALEAAVAEQAAWLRRCIFRHQARLSDKATRLRFHDRIPCISSVSGGGPSLLKLRGILEGIARSQPPLLLSIGQTIPKSWVYAIAMLRAIRDGADAVAAAKAAGDAIDVAAAATVTATGGSVVGSSSSTSRRKPSSAPPAFSGLARPYLMAQEAQHKWLSVVAPALRVSADARILHDALQLMVNQGEVFASCGCIYLQPEHVTSLLKPLVDHRLDRSWAIPRAYEFTNEPYEHSPSVQMLLSAVEVLATSGELREELLPMLWEDVDLKADDYGAVLLMLSASGVLFLSEHTELGRRWVMPMRLPEATPPSLLTTWASLPQGQKLTLCYSLRIAPPGLVERLMASCYGLGYYHQFWRRGALIRAKAVENCAMLIEMLPAIPSGSGNEAASASVSSFPPFSASGHPAGVDERDTLSSSPPPPLHHLVCELRGPIDAYDELAELLVQVRIRADRLLKDFPGLGAIEGIVTGQGADSLPSASSVSAAADLSSAISTSQPNARAVAGGADGEARAPRGDASASASAVARTVASAPGRYRSRYLGELKYGRPIEAHMGLHKIIGVAEADELPWMRLRGEDDVQLEIDRHKALLSANKDALGWTDTDWFRYVHAQPAEERALPSGMFSASRLDRGHQGMRLADFARHPNAVAAGLKRAHVLALRLYSGGVYRTINAALRNGCSLDRPHPYPACVALLAEAIEKLSGRGQSHFRVGSETSHTLWHGVTGMQLSYEFLVRGGTSMGLLSASPSRHVAERYAIEFSCGAASTSASAATVDATTTSTATTPTPPRPSPLLLKLRLPSLPKHGGAEISFLSCFPDEGEVVYGPATYLRPMGTPTLLIAARPTVIAGGRVSLSVQCFRVLEVVPVPRVDKD